MKKNLKVIPLKTPELDLLLCPDVTEKQQELVRFVNPSKEKYALIKVAPVGWQFGIPPKGQFRGVMCGKAFVQPIQTLTNDGKTAAFVRDGYLCYAFDQEGNSYYLDELAPIYRGFYGMDHTGCATIGGYPSPYGENGSPVVYIQDGIGVDAAGGLTMLPEDRVFSPKGYRFILAAAQGNLCITGDRRVICRNEFVLEGERAVAACACRYGYLVLTQNGETRFSTNGRGWQELDDNAVAISAMDDTIAIGDRNGDVFIYQHNDHSLLGCGKLSFPGKHISEIAVSDETVIVKFSDCSFDIIDWRTKKTCLDDDIFVAPDVERMRRFYD